MCVDLMQKVDSKHPELNGKQFIDLDSKELQTLTSEQLGHYFKAVNQNIQKDFDKLFNWINGKYHQLYIVQKTLIVVIVILLISYING